MQINLRGLKRIESKNKIRLNIMQKPELYEVIRNYNQYAYKVRF